MANMNAPPMMLPPRNHTLSPVSTTGSDWSGVNAYDNYNRSESPYSPTIPYNRGELVTPPNSGPNDGRASRPQLPSPMNSMNGYGAPMGSGPMMGPPGGRRPSDQMMRKDPSPPASKAPSTRSRSSDGTLSDQQSKKYRRMEETLAQHYNVLKRFLNGANQLGPNRTNKARDKLLRLSPIQFHELSTDVYDELQRRQASMAPPPGANGPPPRRNVPPYLMPKPEYHEKRNQARQKLSSLQQQRFRDLATDVYCELERRFPRFTGGDIPRNTSAQSMRPPPRSQSSYSQNGFAPPPRQNSEYGAFGPPPPRSQSRGPPPPPGVSSGYSSPIDSRGSLNRAPTLPNLGDFDSDEVGRPLPRQLQSNMIVPNKSTMIEDDDEFSGMEDQYDRRSDAFGLDGPASRRDTSTTSRSGASSTRDGKLLAEAQTQLANMKEQVDDLEATLRKKDDDIARLKREEAKSSENKEWLSIKEDLESQLDSADRMNRSLRDQLNRLNENGGGDGAWKTKFNDLDRDHQSLQEELSEQRRVTEEVRREAAMFLQEMRSMVENGGGNWEREEKLTRDNQRLEEEVKDWKNRYAKSKTQLRQMRAISMGLSLQQNRLSKDGEFREANGLVKDVHVTKFQISIDELLRVARSDEPSAVLTQMKAVVLAIRNITQDIDAAPSDKNEEVVQRRTKLKGKVSATANNVITASKNYASSGGISPVSLLDAAASHLTTAVVELVRMVKVRPTPPGEFEEDDEQSLEALQSPGYFSVAPSARPVSPNESVYSAISAPTSNAARSMKQNGMAHRRSTSKASSISSNAMNGPGPGLVRLGFGMRAQDSDLEELKLYLEDQTEILVRSIQALVNSIRANDDIKNIRGHMNVIANVVGKVVASTESAMREPTANPALRQRAEPLIRSLADCENRLLDASAESESLQDEEQIRDFTNTLPPLAFEIARETKDLVSRLDMIDADDDDDDFN